MVDRSAELGGSSSSGCTSFLLKEFPGKGRAEGEREVSDTELERLPRSLSSRLPRISTLRAPALYQPHMKMEIEHERKRKRKQRKRNSPPRLENHLLLPLLQTLLPLLSRSFPFGGVAPNLAPSSSHRRFSFDVQGTLLALERGRRRKTRGEVEAVDEGWCCRAGCS